MTIKKFIEYIKEDASTTAVVGSGTAVSSGAQGSFVSAAGQSVSGGDSGSALSTNSSVSGMGAITSAQPSTIPGQVWGGDGTIGSGDIGSRGGTFLKKAGSESRKKKKDKSKRKTAKVAKTIDKLFAPNYTSKISESNTGSIIKKFDSFE